jgi:PAS domain S-box-containing protein
VTRDRRSRRGGRLFQALSLAALGGLAAPAHADAIVGRPRFVYGGDAEFAPYDYLDPAGRPTGFSVELARALARDAGVDLEVRLGVWERIRADLDAGTIDLISLSRSDERLKAYDWLVQTWTMHQCVLFPPGRPAYPGTPHDLAGQTIAVQERTAVAELLSGMEPPRPLLVTTATQSEALRLLEAGQATGVGGNSLTLRLAASTHGIYNLVEMPLQEVPYGLMARKGRQELEWVATSMARLRGTGTVETLAERFLAVPAPPHTWRDYAIYLWPLLGVVAAVSAGAVTWTRSLHRQVRLRTEELQRSLRQREEAEEALRASERKYRDIIDSSPVSIHQARPDGTVVMANPAFAALLDCASVEEALRLNMARDVWLDPAERDRLIALYEPLGRAADIEVRVKKKGGTPAWVQMTAKVVKGPDGETRYEVFSRDVSAHKIAEAALRDSEERYRLLFEGNPLPMIAYDVESLRILAVNEAAVRLHGYSREELLGLTVTDLALPDDPNLEQFLATRLDPRPDVVHVGLRQQRRKDGSTVDVDMTSLAIVLAGRPARLILTRDVTAERRALAERERLEEALRRSQAMSAMGALVAGVAHEVRNPLFGISANLDALETEPGGTGGKRDYLKPLRAQVARLSRLMQDLLDYGKPPVLKRAATRPADLVRRALRSCGPLALEHEVTLEQEVAPGLPDLDVDGGRMDQVFENLVANAIQHSPRSGRVRVAARLGPAPGASVAISVENEGEDLPSADIPRLFEPFFSRRKGGTGLGLSIAQRITETHGGHVIAASRPEGGAVFTVTLPVDGSEGADPG